MNLNIGFKFAHQPAGPRPLADMPRGATGRIAVIDVDEQADLQRLELMGLCAGRTVEVVQPGDPMIVRVLGTRIGLARSLALRAFVDDHRED